MARNTFLPECLAITTGISDTILEGLLHNTISIWVFGLLSNPEGFCFDINCNDEPVNDDPTIEDYNVDRMVYFLKKI